LSELSFDASGYLGELTVVDDKPPPRPPRPKPDKLTVLKESQRPK
jgi:hypothetical protein